MYCPKTSAHGLSGACVSQQLSSLGHQGGVDIHVTQWQSRSDNVGAIVVRIKVSECLTIKLTHLQQIV